MCDSIPTAGEAADEAAEVLGPDPWTEFPAGSEDEPTWTPPATVDLALVFPGSLILAILGVPGEAPRVVRVISVEDRVAVYRGNDLQFDAPFDELSRTLHRAVKLYNAELAALG